MLKNQHTANSWFSFKRKKNTQKEHITAHFEYFFTCHDSKAVGLTEKLNEIKITHYEKSFLISSKNFLILRRDGKRADKENIFCLTEITIIFTEIHRIKTKPKIVTKISNY